MTPNNYPFSCVLSCGLLTFTYIPYGTNAGGGGSPTEVQLNLIKQEEMGSMPMHQRPGTSTGYEGGDMMYTSSQPSWQVDLERPSSRTASSHSFRERGQQSSFREPGQSFLAPSSTATTTAAAAAAQSHSFLSFPGAGTSSRPSTSSGLADTLHPRSLPPLAAVVSASLSSPQGIANQQQSQSVFPFHALRRPSTASSRPGTAPASASFFSRSSSSTFVPGGGVGSSSSSSGRPDLSLLHSGFGGRTGFGAGEQYVGAAAGGYDATAAGEVPTSPGGIDASPFYFHPPALDPTPASATVANTNTSPAAASNPRKRAFGGPDGPHDDAPTAAHGQHGGHPAQQPPGSSSGIGSLLGDLNYDYGSESRPQSRRLSVMELCNDDSPEHQRPASQHQQGYATGPGAFLLSAATSGPGYGGGSRPTTSSGLVSGASALRLFDRTGSPPTAGSTAAPTSSSTAALFARASHAAAGATGPGVAPSTGSAEFGRGAVHALYAGSGSGASATSGSASSTASPSTPTPPGPGAVLQPAPPPSTTSYAPPGPATSLSGPGAPPVYRQQQQYHALAHSPAFSGSPGSSSSTGGGYGGGGGGPRSPASPASSDSDASPRPFARAHPYANAYAGARRSPGGGGDVFSSSAAAGGGAGAGGTVQYGGYGGGPGAGRYGGYGRDDGRDGDGRDARDDAGQQQQQQRDGQVRVGAPHAAASFGAMRA
ncbi:unnamed protein product [Cyclocybe aegerita]|uniref:Proteophosphoglycan ppg4 n=1 Tax=Cyclocybe aegerita TaxID=1973307 RepID=A0A8S0WMP9_CYCAE|nr:unnamed protein product [Cyclocybe aegerita]